ncbi:CUE domain-containing protein 5 like [Verticillium longisporum]|nr:CUE domain-containing protein 5 like [Verticillium longisporum]
MSAPTETDKNTSPGGPESPTTALAMSAPTETDKNTSPGAPESPTTARPLEMDDDDVQDSGIVGDDASKTTPAAASTTAATSDETPPTKPPRPLTEAQKNEAILKEAFPGIDATVIRAVLTASRGQIDPAFNALLEMTDPDAAQREPSEEAPPPQPPRPSGPAHTMSQLEKD